jgi:dCTP deaminase
VTPLLIVGENLRALLEQHSIVNDPSSFDNNSLALKLGRSAILIGRGAATEITYGRTIPESCIERVTVPDEGIVIHAKGGILGCSREHIEMPMGYFGFLQTKGSFARLLALVNCCDGQVEAGYKGKVTFEILNLSDLDIRVLPGARVAQLFIFKTSTHEAVPYNGRYQGADGPTIQEPEL